MRLLPSVPVPSWTYLHHPTAIATAHITGRSSRLSGLMHREDQPSCPVRMLLAGWLGSRQASSKISIMGQLLQGSAMGLVGVSIQELIVLGMGRG